VCRNRSLLYLNRSLVCVDRVSFLCLTLQGLEVDAVEEDLAQM